MIENQIGIKEIKSSIIGIGLNVNQSNFDGLNATSMMMAMDKKFYLEEVLFELIASINETIANFWLRDDRLEEEYLERLIGYNEARNYKESDGSRFSGKILGTNKRGLLRMMVDGREKEFDLKEIEFLIESDF